MKYRVVEVNGDYYLQYLEKFFFYSKWKMSSIPAFLNKEQAIKEAKHLSDKIDRVIWEP